MSKIIFILITSRIDYDDRIYYDAVNDVRKAVNIHKPILFYMDIIEIYLIMNYLIYILKFIKIIQKMVF